MTRLVVEASQKSVASPGSAGQATSDHGQSCHRSDLGTQAHQLVDVHEVLVFKIVSGHRGCAPCAMQLSTMNPQACIVGGEPYSGE
jgi:hypothetical protein